ncbi:MAG TPA: DNA polymerase I [Chloroflexota bacterium]
MPDKLALIDGNSLVYRAFHALPQDLTSNTGELANATYGFIMMLMRAQADLKPTHIAAAFDTPKPTFRHEQYAQYKATRAAMPDGLSHQFQRVYELLEAFRIPMFRYEGVEADDLIGTLARKASERGLDVVIISGDTDAFQLIGPKVRVLAPRRGVTDAVLYDEAAIQTRYGLRPPQLIDHKSLVGDTSDNIPGVPGIGDKTATKLLAEYGDLEGVRDHLDQLPAKQRQVLESYMGQVFKARELVTIVQDVPVELDLDAMAVKEDDRPRTLELFHELSFRTLIDRLPPPGRLGTSRAAQPGLFDAAEPAPARPEVHTIASLGELEGEVERLLGSPEPVAVELALTAPGGLSAEIVGIAVATPSSAPFYVPLGGSAPNGGPLPPLETLEVLRPLFEDGRGRKTSMDVKQLTVALGQAGLGLDGAIFDVGLAAYLIEAGQRTLTLQDLSWARLHRELPSLKSITGEGRSAVTLSEAPVEKAAAFFGERAQTLAEIEPLLEEELKEGKLDRLYDEVDLPLVPVLAEMEQTGISVDVPYLQELSKELYERVHELENEIYLSVGHDFNIGSPQQLATILFDELNLSGGKKTSTGRQSTAAEVLNELKGAHPCIELILEHRELTKLKSTYVDALPLLVNTNTRRVHTTYHQTVAATGRLSSSDPNLQNIPIRTELGRRVRRAFVAPEPGWVLLSADYSQIELRIEAHLSQDPTLMEAFLQGEDVHAATAAELNGVPIEEVTRDMRGIAKTANFAMIYGVSPFGFAQQTGLSQHEAADFMRRYFEKFPGVSAFQKRLIAEARESGTVTTLLGRKRTIPELRSQVRQVRAAGERMAINAPVQGTASDIIKIAMVRLFRHMQEREMRSRMLLQVHDELLFESPEDELDQMKKSAKEIMEGALELSVPLVVDFKSAPNWGAMY